MKAAPMVARSSEPPPSPAPGAGKPWRRDKRWASYAGRRWKIARVRGAYALLERRGCSQWVHVSLCH